MQILYAFTKKFWIKISQIVLKSGHCFVIGAKILQTNKFLQVWEQMVIRRCNIWRIGRVIQFDEASLSNSSVNMWMGALSWRSSTPRRTLPRPFSTMTERSRSMINAKHGSLIVVPRGRHSVSRTPSLISENNHHHHFSSWSFLAQSSWCLFTWPLSDLGFQLTERIVVVNPGLIAGYDAIKKLDRIYFVVLQELLTTIHTIGTLNWCQQFRSPPCANLLHPQLIVHDLMDNGQFFSYATNRDLSIMHYDPFYGFNVFIDSDDWWAAHSGCIFETVFWVLESSHPFGDSAVRWSRVFVNILQLLANFDGIQPFSSEKFYDCSMLNVRHLWKMKTYGSQNVFSFVRRKWINRTKIVVF